MSRFAPRLARRLAAVAVFASAASFVGCIKESDDVTVKADGSGSYTEVMTVDMSAMKGIEEMFKGMMPKPPEGAGMEGDKPAPAPDDKNPLDDLKKQWKGLDGLEVTKAEKTERDGKMMVNVEAKFKSLEVYAKATSMDMNAELKKNDDGSYTLKFASNDEGAEMAGAMLPMLEKFLADMEVSRKLTLPGKITETNGTKSDDGTSVTWKLTFADLKKNNGKTEPQTVTFKGDDLDLKPFSITRKKEMGEPGK